VTSAQRDTGPGESWRQYAVTLPPKTMLLPSGVLTLTDGYRLVGDDLMCPTAALDRARKVAGELGGVVVVRDVRSSEWRPVEEGT